MATSAQDIVRQIYEKARQLPPESLNDLAQYVEFLRFKVKVEEESSQVSDDLRIVHPRGLLKGVDVSPQTLASARREMWCKLESA
ncbi:MAG: hypothetical protein GY764_04435 [Halieaceae bacterium]|nr:hypothetical protein [Halieaceae bacterium]